MRLRFDVEDLARTAFALPGPYCELAVSAQLLQQSASPFRRLWLSRRSGLAPSARQLLDIVPPHGSVPEFLCPEATSCLDEALDRVRSTPAARIHAQLAELPWPSPPSPWVRELARGGAGALAELSTVMHAYYDDVMAPLWPSIERAVSAELSHRAWQVASQGIAATLNTLHPRIRWQDGVLEVDTPIDGDVELAGRGLRLMPSIWTRPGVALGWTRPTLCYPLPSTLWDRRGILGDDDHDALADVLGATRTRILRALLTEHTTSGLARSLDISTASASMHAAALRGAGLVSSRRDGRAVRHVVTALGQRLATVTQSEPAPPLTAAARAARRSASGG
ncbi:ArsR family transcriptional regulator [Phytohabitans houttuyneae]